MLYYICTLKESSLLIKPNLWPTAVVRGALFAAFLRSLEETGRCGPGGSEPETPTPVEQRGRTLFSRGLFSAEDIFSSLSHLYGRFGSTGKGISKGGKREDGGKREGAASHVTRPVCDRGGSTDDPPPPSRPVKRGAASLPILRCSFSSPTPGEGEDASTPPRSDGGSCGRVSPPGAAQEGPIWMRRQGRTCLQKAHTAPVATARR